MGTPCLNLEASSTTEQQDLRAKGGLLADALLIATQGTLSLWEGVRNDGFLGMAEYPFL